MLLSGALLPRRNGIVMIIWIVSILTAVLTIILEYNS